MACHTPPLKKAKKQGKLPLSILSPIPFTKCKMGLRMGTSIYHCFFAILRRGVQQAIPNETKRTVCIHTC